jgi:hypothetical protein
VTVVEYKVNTLLPVHFEEIENPPYLNDSRFQAVRCYVAHEKENYNGSYFDLSVLESMGKRMAGVPIVGYIAANNINEKDFKGHEQRLVIDDNGVSIEYLGRAYGCVISNDDVTIVDRMHEDGTMRKYLCVTGVLWKMFTDCIDIFDRDSIKPHSMELEENSIVGKFEKDGYYHFSDATVRALCILGDGVSPAMSNSVIEKFSQSDINNNIQELLKEVNESIKQFSLNQSSVEVDNINNPVDKGGNNLDKIELLQKYNLTVEQLDFSIEELSIEQLEEKLKEFTSKTDKPEISFSATYRQKREAIQNALVPKVEKDAEGNITYEEYLWLNDFDDQYAFVEKTIWTPDYQNKYGRYSYTLDEETMVATITSEFEEMVLTWLTPEENQKIQDERNNIVVEFEKVKGEYEEYKNKYSTPNEEVVRLQEFERMTLATERKEAEDTLFSQFKDLEGNDEFEDLKKNASNFTLEQLEKEVAFIMVKNGSNFKFSAKSTPKKEKVKIEFSKTDGSVDEIDQLFNKYLKKN